MKAPAAKAEKAAAAAKQLRVKKEFDLPGQTRETPDETDPLRKFYTSLLQEKPDSFMARKWCVMHGLLDREDAEEFIKQNKAGKAGATPTKAPAAKARTTSAAAKRPAASSGKKAPAAKKAAAGDDKPKAKAAPKRKAAAKKDKLDWDDSESDDADDDSSDDEVPLAQRKAAKA
eukprot:GHUV01039892.1.p1 GENE.GHUV01039892.1~~GHUV01039892.1.p1  ORF type:complete len:174 (+),score=96.85 GHUV01039892.1:329-850(+)